MLYFICPKCGNFTLSVHNVDEKCKYCNAIMIETPYEFPMGANAEDEKKRRIIEQQIFNDYVKNNSLYDPKEQQKTNKIKEQKRTEEIERELVYGEPQMNKPVNAPKCPTCGSTNVQKIGTVERGVSVAAFGLFSGKLGKTMKCNHCGYKW